MRAILPASATAAVLTGARASRPRSQAPSLVLLTLYGQRRASALNEHLAQIFAAPLGDADKLRFPAGRDLPRREPSQAARSRPRANVAASPMAAERAVALRGPTPGIDIHRRAPGSVLAASANSASK